MLKRKCENYENISISKSENIVRRHSFSSEKDTYFLKNIKNINNTPMNLKLSDGVIDAHSIDNVNDLFCSKIIEFYKIKSASDISSKDYVFCGMASTFSLGNFGMSLDHDGNLIIIKGGGYDLFKGLIKKYISGYQYEVTNITDGKCKIKFNNLYVNEDGLLIGDEKNTEKSYSINIVVIPCKNDVDGQKIEVNFIEYRKTDENDRLTFKVDAETSVSYFFENNKIYLKSIKKKNKLNDFSLMNFEISIPLKKKLIYLV